MDQNEDDPAFLRGEQSVPRSCSVIIEELLNQVIEEGTDLGDGNGLQALKGDGVNETKDKEGTAG